MTDRPRDPQGAKSIEDEREANKRFEETLGRLVNTPHKPHEPLKTKTPSGNPKGARVSDKK